MAKLNDLLKSNFFFAIFPFFFRSFFFFTFYQVNILVFQDLKEECESRELPKELLDEDEELDLDEEDEARAMDLLSRYNKILNTLTDNCMKAENLIVCWTKLDEDTKELTAALR